jgi:hypothetical protein
MAIAGALGPIIFMGGLGSANTFHSISKANKQVFVKHRLLQTLDLVEATGVDLIELQIEMHFHGPYTLAPSAGIAALETVMSLKIPLPLIIGRVPVGRGLLTLFVIEAIESKMTRFVGSGLAVADATIRLLEYPNPFGSLGPLSALGGALPGLSGFVGTLNNVANLANIAGTIPGLSKLTAPLTGAIGAVTGAVGIASNVFSSVTGGITAISNVTNSIQAAATALSPGGISGVITATAGQVQGALASLQAAGKATAATIPR